MTYMRTNNIRVLSANIIEPSIGEYVSTWRFSCSVARPCLID